MNIGRLARSFAGCDGGNVIAEFWVCGIEFHGDALLLEKVQPFLSPYSTEWSYPPRWPEHFAPRLGALVRDWVPGPNTFDTLLAELCRLVFHGRHNHRNRNDYLNYRLYQADGDIFKLNLFPLPCQEDDPEHWTDLHRAVSGYLAKEDYVQRCVQSRRLFFREMIDRYKPQVILCAGVRRCDDFKEVFLGNRDAIQTQPLQVNGNEVKRYHDQELNFDLLITPFFSWRQNCLHIGDMPALADLLIPILHLPLNQ